MTDPTFNPVCNMSTAISPSTRHPKSAPGSRVLIVTLLIAMAGLPGCVLATITPPSVNVMDVHLTGIGLAEQHLAVTLCVTNPNASSLAFRRVSADLDVSGSPLAAGVSDLAVRLSPQSSTIVPFTVVTTVENLGPQLLGILKTGTVEYHVHGTVTLEGELGLTLPYSRSGHLDLLAAGFGLAAAASEPAPSSCVAVTGMFLQNRHV